MFSRSTWAIRRPPWPGSGLASSSRRASRTGERCAYLWKIGMPLDAAVLDR